MKKLSLNRETVRNLTHSDLDRVVGGRPPIPCDISDSGADTDCCGGGGGGGTYTCECPTDTCPPTDTCTTTTGSGTSPKCCVPCIAPSD